jgi:hypothetical protein
MSLPNTRNDPVVVHARPLEVEVVPTSAQITILPLAFIQSLNEVEQQCLAISDKINNAENAAKANELIVRLTKAGKLLESERKKAKQPFLDGCRIIDEAAKVPECRIGMLKNMIGPKIVKFQMDEAARLRKEEEARPNLQPLL